MTARRAPWVALVGHLALSSCAGHGAIFLTVEGVGPLGVLKIPEQLDTLSVQVSTADGATVLLDKAFPLGAEQNFPLTLGLEPGPKTGARVRVTVTALLAGAQVATAESLVAMNPAEVTSVTVRLTVE